MTIEEGLLPIKRVMAAESDYHANEPGGKDFEPLVEVNSAVIGERIAEIDAMVSGLEANDSLWPNTPAVGVVKLLPLAVAKTKRPLAILNDQTCPIIGGSGLGELYVSVTKNGLATLRRVIQHASGGRPMSHLSTIESMRLYTPEDVLGETNVRHLIQIAKQRPLRLIMFRHHNQQSDRKIQSDLRTIQQKSQSRFSPLQYSHDVDVYEFRAENAEAVRSIISFPGTRNLGAFPQYSVVRTATRVIGSLPANRIPGPLAEHDYPYVGQVDTGTDPHNLLLQSWVHARWNAVPEEQQLNAHGSSWSYLRRPLT